MLVRKTSTFGLLWLVWLAQSLPSWAATGPLKVEIHLDQYAVSPGEPVSGVAIVSNPTTAEVTHCGIWMVSVLIGSSGPSGTTWRMYHRLEPRHRPRARVSPPGHRVQAAPPPPKKRKFSPGWSQPFLFTVAVDSRGAHVFGEPGKVLLKAKYAGIQSKPATVLVRNVGAAEEAAHASCRAKQYICLGWRAGSEYVLTRHEVRELAKFVAEHPGTRYQSLVRLALASAYVRGIEGDKDEKRALELLEPLLTTTDGGIRQWALYGAAFAHHGLGHAKEANEMLVRLKEKATDRFFRCLADDLSAKLKQGTRGEVFSRPGKPPPPRRVVNWCVPHDMPGKSPPSRLHADTIVIVVSATLVAVGLAALLLLRVRRLRRRGGGGIPRT